MLAIFDATGTRIKHTYNGLDTNDPTDALDSTYRLDSWSEYEDLHAVEEPHTNMLDGMESYGVVKLKKHFIVNGTILGSTVGDMYDHVHALCLAYDPALASKVSPDTNGYMKYTFKVPTADTSNYSSGLVDSFYWLRAEADVIPPMGNHDGLSIAFQLRLAAVDPVRYFATQQSKTISSSTSVDNSLASYFSYGTIVITMSGAGSSTYTFRLFNTDYDVDRTITLDLSGASSGDVYSVDCQKQKITDADGTDLTDTVFVSAPDGWPLLVPDTNTAGAAFTTNVTSSILKWYRGFAA